MYLNFGEFREALRKHDVDTLLEFWFSSDAQPFVFAANESLERFLSPIRNDWLHTEELHIGGTSAWRYSLNPSKMFKEFDEDSDIDVVNISDSHFRETWDEIRKRHRATWYLLDSKAKKKFRRMGENVYSGFVSPKWIPHSGNPLRFSFVSHLETYSKHAPGHRSVNMLFFRNLIEAKDYYRRGIESAKERLSYGVRNKPTDYFVVESSKN